MTSILVAEVAVRFKNAGQERVSAGDLADALMDDWSVMTVRVDYDGCAAVYRADVESNDPREALTTAMRPVGDAADQLLVEYAVVYAEVTHTDPSVPFTGRALALRWDSTDKHRKPLDLERA
jgi:hypothetical protein